MTREDYIRVLRDEPVRIAHMAGFDKLGALHNEWLKEMLYGQEDMTLLAHRLSYKTTAVSVALAMYVCFLPKISTLFLRKTDTDVKEIIHQTHKMLLSEEMRHVARVVMGAPYEIITATATEINTSYNASPRGQSQLLGMGIGGSMTGKHYDRIFTDDIVNLTDRRSRAERERTKATYMELQNIRTHGGRIINTGTPWHKEDAIATLMPNVEKYDCYTTGIMPDSLIAEKRRSMAPSLFAANYELQHIASENALFDKYPAMTPDAAQLRDGIAHIDAAYGGEDYTALTCGKRRGDTLYLYGRLWQKHVDTVLDAALAKCAELMCEPVYCENNGDKGYLGREIRNRGVSVRVYPEKMNKYAKISSYLRKWWGNIVFLEGTDPEYIAQIMDYTEDAEHDDAPDSAACVCRALDMRG